MFGWSSYNHHNWPQILSSSSSQSPCTKISAINIVHYYRVVQCDALPTTLHHKRTVFKHLSYLNSFPTEFLQHRFISIPKSVTTSITQTTRRKSEAYSQQSVVYKRMRVVNNLKDGRRWALNTQTYYKCEDTGEDQNKHAKHQWSRDWLSLKWETSQINEINKSSVSHMHIHQQDWSTDNNEDTAFKQTHTHIHRERERDKYKFHNYL